MKELILQTSHISKSFGDAVDVPVLSDINLQLAKGEFVSVTGKSGCGKSTLLYVLSTMDTDYDGELYIDGVCMNGKTEPQLARVRNEKIGFVFQFHYLLNEFSVLQNVMMPALRLGRWEADEIRQRAYDKLVTLDMAQHAQKKPNQLSGGQKQRVAIARALINDPLIIMGDEPTGNLDKRNSEIVFETFLQLAQTQGQTLLIVTHDQEFARRTGRTIQMQDGKVA
ncbi:lipoprotein-releasing system ATP-binding protein [Dyadobacter soli]|uniref:Lipoprotein-releasing system ATP-binding protein n=1 Tax=Dyadobacter soli TaxID=659014 RepID=A0A1G7M4H6_9BACT|nr:ABC transporter ATP-binding protein [Dyadobacter soli]SDF56581.1 lipoprotein-releasing system ATP-binding protein [Dyadobacter soli]